MSLFLSQNELKIMELIWKSDHPLSRSEILDNTKDRTWSPSSIHLILNSMLSKGCLKIADTEVRYGRTYAAAISRNDYVAQYMEDVSHGQTQKDKLLDVVAALVNRQGVDQETLDELGKMLEERREELAQQKGSDSTHRKHKC